MFVTGTGGREGGGCLCSGEANLIRFTLIQARFSFRFGGLVQGSSLGSVTSWFGFHFRVFQFKLRVRVSVSIQSTRVRPGQLSQRVNRVNSAS
ncbi:hypothetical protein HanHA300_Chr14g0511891 [Helianthus annuus]|nr:hypothetical protein HanHA300_Chr14g0511891 [Helianthus annuus]KAJ0484512.1 hypothetical protein HanHA89_Chr14g0544941 [Helianthus annuus]KAJ0658780.1 hypothetical protein HanOQP8_Chr14g0512061 [Helianthus annuus]